MKDHRCLEKTCPHLSTRGKLGEMLIRGHPEVFLDQTKIIKY